MSVTLEVRVGTLESKVHNLETFAGPGQNEALVANLKEIRKALAGLEKGQKQQDRLLGEHTRLVGEQTRMMTHMSADLLQVKASVDDLKAEHGEILAEHSRILCEHTEALAEILRRLPEPAPEGPGSN